MDRILDDPMIGLAAFFLLLFCGGGIVAFAVRLILGTVIAGFRSFSKLADLMRLPALPKLPARKLATVHAAAPAPARSRDSEKNPRADRSDRSERPAAPRNRADAPRRQAAPPSELSEAHVEYIDENMPSPRRGEYREEED